MRRLAMQAGRTGRSGRSESGTRCAPSRAVRARLASAPAPESASASGLGLGLALLPRLALTVAVLLAWTVAAASAAAAQRDDISVEAALQDNAVYIGDSVLLTVRVRGTSDRISVEPEFPQIEALRFETRPSVSSNQVTYSTGRGSRREVRIEYNYRVTGLAAGNHEIPRFRILVEGKPYFFEPTILTVVQPERDARLDLTASVNETTCYPDQRIVLTYRLYFDRNSSNIERYVFNVPLLERAGELNMSFLRPPAGANVQELNLDGNRAPAETSIVERRGTRYLVYAVRISLFPTDPGKLYLPPANIQADMVIGYKRSRDLFGRRVPEVKRLYASAEGITLDVKPLPRDGQPDSFYGLVGKYEIESSVDRTEVKVGDPIRLQIRIKGDGILDRVRRPPLAELPGFENFKVDDDLSPGDREAGVIVFEQNIRARSQEIEEIPPIELAYFDIDSERYEVMRTPAIPIEVKETRVVSVAEIEGPTGIVRPNVEKLDREQRRGGINANHIYVDALENQRIDPMRVVPPLAAPLAYALLALVVTVRRRTRGDQAAVRARGARKRAQERLQAARAKVDGDEREFFHELSLAIHRYFVDRFNLGEGEMTAADVARLREEGRLAADAAAEAAALLETCDSARFGASSTDRAEREALLQRTDELFRRVEK